MPVEIDNRNSSVAEQPVGAMFHLCVMLNSLVVPNWIYVTIERIAAEEKCRVVLMQSPLRGQPSRDAHSPLLFQAWSWLELALPAANTSAFRMKDLRVLVGKGAVSVMTAQRSEAAGSDGDVEELRSSRPDLILDLSLEPPTKELSACARHGAWWPTNVPDPRQGTVPGLFWDMYEDNCIARYGPSLMRSTPEETHVLYRSALVTNRISITSNGNSACWDLANALSTRILNLARERIAPERSTAPCAPLVSTTLKNAAMMPFLQRWTESMAKHAIKRCFGREQWSILLQKRYENAFLPQRSKSCMLVPPADRFYADPFLLEKDGRTYLFFEDFSYASRKGVIGCCEVHEDGTFGTPRVVLERPYHLSYPFVFTWNGDCYMVPETRQNGTIERYRATRFPDCWVREGVLMSGVSAADSTLLHHHEKWWLFTAGYVDHSPPESSLWLFSADTLDGPWIRHPKNPIISDPCSARPAGGFFFEDGVLIRPCQDSSAGYGSATRLHAVEVLSDSDYRETYIRTISPDQIPGCIGIHTFNRSSRFDVIDCKMMVPRFESIARAGQLLGRH